jgi:hydrogenase maturation protease
MRFSVVGIGSRAGRDDGVGLALVERLERNGRFPELSFLLWENADAATVAYNLLELETPVLLVDCADMGLAPGECRMFDQRNVSLNLRTDSISTHGLGLAEALTLARSLGFEQDAHVFGVQPFDLNPGLSLSSRMEERFDDLCDALGTRIEDLVQRDG